MTNYQMKPWLKSLDRNLLIDVSKLITFLQSKIRDLDLDRSSQFNAVHQKVAELQTWSRIAGNVLNLRKSSTVTDFVDLIGLFSQPFAIIECEFNEKKVKVFVLKDEEQFEEEEQCEEKLPPCVESSGFIITKCLRRLRNKNESRDIFTMVRCEVDLATKTILRVHRDDNFILKRVGKLKSNAKYNSRVKREFKVQSLLSQLNHPSINRIFSYHEDEDNVFAVSYSGGQCDLLQHLQEIIAAGRESISEQQTAVLFRGAVEGLLVAHNLGVAHRDVSLENLVFNKTGNAEFLEIIDWGHSCCVDLKSGETELHGAVGKERYFAPELLNEERDTYDPLKADVFSLGVCLYTSLIGQMPFQRHGDNRSAKLKESVRSLLSATGKLNKLTPVAVDLLQCCLKFDVAERSSLREILEHEFFRI